MSGHGIHVHGAHDHAVEHEAHRGGLGQQVAIFSAVLATVGAIVSFLGGHTQNEALYHKNEAVLKKAEASNMWNYYQAKSTKQNLAEFASSLATDSQVRDKFAANVKRYEAEKEDIRKQAEKLEAESKAANDRSEHALHPHH
jgi:septal ring factor EnvC (AmiA/AmiB activator)